MCVKGSLVLVLVLDWTQCLPQGVGAPPAMLRGRTAVFPPKKLGSHLHLRVSNVLFVAE